MIFFLVIIHGVVLLFNEILYHNTKPVFLVFQINEEDGKVKILALNSKFLSIVVASAWLLKTTEN